MNAVAAPDRRTTGTELSVLAAPARILGVVLLILAAAASFALAGWAADFGGLVYVTFAMYVGASAWLLRWGIMLGRDRTRRPSTSRRRRGD